MFLVSVIRERKLLSGALGNNSSVKFITRIHMVEEIAFSISF